MLVHVAALAKRCETHVGYSTHYVGLYRHIREHVDIILYIYIYRYGRVLGSNAVGFA